MGLLKRNHNMERRRLLVSKAVAAFGTALKLMKELEEENESTTATRTTQRREVDQLRNKIVDAMEMLKELERKEATTKQKGNKVDDDDYESRTIVKRDITKVSRPNLRHPGMTDGLEVVYEEGGRGRHVKAVEDIPVGTTILAEEPVITVLEPSRLGTHCLHCFALILANFPCVWCVEVNFCSVKCRDLALKTYHAYECALTPLLNRSGLDLTAMMALRAVTRFGRRKVLSCIEFEESSSSRCRWRPKMWLGISSSNGEESGGEEEEESSSSSSAKSESDDFLHSRGNDSDQEGGKNQRKNSSEDDDDGCEEEERWGEKLAEKEVRVCDLEGARQKGSKWSRCYRSLDFANALHHFAPAAASQPSSSSSSSEDNKRRREEYLKRGLMARAFLAAFLTKCLKNLSHGFFDNNTAAEGTEGEEIAVAAVIEHFLRVLPANSHDVGVIEMFNKECSVRGGEMASLGAGLYNTLSLFNHSCVPCFVRVNLGNAVVCVAIRNIAAGEEVTENYGLFHTNRTK